MKYFTKYQQATALDKYNSLYNTFCMQPIQEGEKEVKDLEDWAAVQKVYQQTKSKRATAKILNISRNTVKRLLDMTEPPVYLRIEYSSKIDEYKELVIEWRCDPYNYNGTRI